MKLGISYGVMGLGALLLVTSIAWPMVFPSTSYWDQADEDQLEEIQSKVHNLSYLVAQAEQQTDPRKNKMSGEKMMEYRELKVKAQEMLDERDAAIQRPGFISSLLRYTGLGGLVVGVIGYYVVREAD